MATSEQRPTAGLDNPGAPQAIEELVAVARSLIQPDRRRFLGITGAPGAGKSTLAETLRAALGSDAVLVSMDGFHLRDDELRRLGRHERKGACDTFDVAGFLHLLRRLHSRQDEVVYAPLFDRAIEESIGSAIPVPRDTPLIITEGNYLLVDVAGWEPVRELLDETWYVEPGEDERLRRLVARHVEFGRSVHEAQQRSQGSDGRNAALIRSSKRHATRVVSVPHTHPSEASLHRDVDGPRSRASRF